MHNTRLWIGRAFWTGAVLTFVGLLAFVISVVLRAVGDDTGAFGVWGVFLVAAVAWVLDVVALIALLAWRSMHDDKPDSNITPT